ncbi:MAG: aminotransferase class I/II-fold pyridoxal phosphate-dependent enzyme [Bacteroidia bacterium]|nr:aminotransferase class I/II-fold pyridoxal phosphate-dependent enzyme [Bacteroidia bacterium]
MAENLIGSEIIKLANEVNELIRKGEKISNFTIGDFDPAVFPIPERLAQRILEAYKQGQTNYPVANGMPDLRKAVSRFINRSQKLDYSADEVLITGGARPAIYGIYKTLIDPGDTVIYPVPSWNNNHYCHLTLAKGVMVETTADKFFMPDASQLKPHISNATLIALCSPLNPTGTVFGREQLSGICELVLNENEKRKGKSKPLYIMYDQVYSSLLFSGTHHYDPVSLFPEMRPYTLFVDGISKSFAATGVRVGWAFGPKEIISRMAAILSHVGAWAPKAEQIAVTHFVNDDAAVDSFLNHFRTEIDSRLQAFYKAFQELKSRGYSVECIAPQAAIYLTVKFDLKRLKTTDGLLLKDQVDVTSYLLNKAGLAIVPFSAFGSSHDSPWYRLSVGTCRGAMDVPQIMNRLESALSELK